MRSRLIRQLIAGVALVGVITGAYAIVLLALGHYPSASERNVLALSLGATVVVAILYPRAHERTYRAAKQLLQAQRPPPDEPLRLFTGRLSRAIPLEELLLQTAETLRRALGLRAAEIWTGSGGELERTVSDPDRGPARLSLANEQPVVAREGVAGEGFASVWLAPLLQGREAALLRVAPSVRAGEVLGLIVAERSADAQAFTDREDQMLGELARQVALALHNARLDSALQASLESLRRQADELKASRARIVASADAERRRIERDLHDGAQQRLVGLMVHVEDLRQTAATDPDAAPAAIDGLQAELQSALDELRELSHGIYPPLLSDAGLPEALSAVAARAPLRCRVDSDDVGRYPAETEAAVYFCCLEALQNAGKHAGGGAQVLISLGEEAGRFVFVVEDDGRGFDPEGVERGVGLTNMRDRLGAVGGCLEVSSSPGRGARIHGFVPVRRPLGTDR